MIQIGGVFRIEMGEIQKIRIMKLLTIGILNFWKLEFLNCIICFLKTIQFYGYFKKSKE